MSIPRAELQIGDPTVSGLSKLNQWLATCTATVFSLYALDAVAMAAGLLLVATQVFQGAGQTAALLFLAMTYAVWGAGLSVALRANLALLEATGTSTNVLSKALFDLARHRNASTRVRSVAAGIGYAGTEIVKETPYYAAAFGAVLLTDHVSPADALVFLGGANLGAAVYEYGLGHLTRAFLRHKGRPAHASFETDWVPCEYLADYYSAVEPDERRTIAYFVDAIAQSPADEPVLCLGTGPTLHHVFLAANRASEIHLSDYLPANLREIENWIAREPRAHDWRPFVRYTLECEGIASPTGEEIMQREEMTRAKLTKLLEADLRQPLPLGAHSPRLYGSVISAYCACSATSDRETWETYMERIAALVRPGGTLLIAALRRSRGYRVGGKLFPSPNIDEHDLRRVLERHFRPEDLDIVAVDLAGTDSKGYSSIVLASGHRRM